MAARIGSGKVDGLGTSQLPANIVEAAARTRTPGRLSQADLEETPLASMVSETSLGRTLRPRISLFVRKVSVAMAPGIRLKVLKSDSKSPRGGMSACGPLRILQWNQSAEHKFVWLTDERLFSLFVVAYEPLLLCGDVVSKTSEWNLLKNRFDELVDDESVGADTLETIFDVEFHRRFAELINRIAGSQSKSGTPASSGVSRKGHF